MKINNVIPNRIIATAIVKIFKGITPIRLLEISAEIEEQVHNTDVIRAIISPRKIIVNILNH